MRLLKEALGFLGALVVLAVIVALVAPKKAHALAAALVQIVPGTTTHVGQNESQLVSLECDGGKSFCTANDPSGVPSTTPYVVPSGYTLIVTDWVWAGSGGAAPGNLSADFLFNANASPGQLAFSEALTTSEGAYEHEHYLTGIRVGSGAQLVDSLAAEGNGTARIQGYLVPND
jgi:hypothetical protein